MNFVHISTLLITLIWACSTAALQPLSGNEMAKVIGQGGVYLSGDLTINSNGGPINEDAPDDNGYWKATCTPEEKSCGGRLAFNTSSEGGFLVLDNIRGRFSFSGLTLTTRAISSTVSNVDSFGQADVDAFLTSGGSNVLELGLPTSINFQNVSFTLAASNFARPTDNGFSQTDIFSININGTSNLQGNVLLFPTGNP